MVRHPQLYGIQQSARSTFFSGHEALTRGPSPYLQFFFKQFLGSGFIPEATEPSAPIADPDGPLPARSKPPVARYMVLETLSRSF
jgi:hypothetical protein